MTTITERELLEQALEELLPISHNSTDDSRGQADKAIALIRAALSSPATALKPVAWMDDFGNAFPFGANKGAGSWLDAHKRNWKPLYLHPPATAPEQPSWHDAPTEPGLWVVLDKDGNDQSYRVIKPEDWLPEKPEGDRWYGPIQEDKP